MSIDAKVAEWLLQLPKPDLMPQAELYFAYRKIVDKPLAFWYVKTGYEWEQKKKEMYTK